MAIDDPGMHKPIDTSSQAAEVRARDEILAQVNVTVSTQPRDTTVADVPDSKFLKVPPIQPEGKEGKVSFGRGYEPLVSMDLPGWIHQPRNPALPPNVFKEEYTPTQDNNQRARIVIDGMPPITDAETAGSLRRLLMDPKIDDTKTPYSVRNIESIRGALNEGQDIPEDFAIESAQTRTMQSGRRVLFVMGSYTHEDTKALTAYIDSDPRHPGQSLVAVNYFASKALFDKYLPSAEQAIMTMKLSRQSPEQAGSSSQ